VSVADPDPGQPFSDKQVEIVRRLQENDGVVVQGPPSTGKTHTISNIICHYLTLGRRVLVVSHGEPAPSVLRDQLPPEGRDLASASRRRKRRASKDSREPVGYCHSACNIAPFSRGIQN
jgi:hypothetical protein